MNFLRTAGRGSKALMALGACVLVVALGLGGYLLALRLSGNFHEVVAGELYRSGQPTGGDIDKAVTAHGIKTIINLRGGSPGAKWYDAEMEASQRLGVTHVDFRMSDKQELTQARAAELVDLMAKAEKPLLVHCQAGADRSGLASALYLAAILKRDEAAAQGQIALRFGHISLPVSPAYAMDRSFEALEPWLGFSKS